MSILHILFSILLATTNATPVPELPAAGDGGYAFQLQRRSFRQGRPTHEPGAVRIFDPSYPKRELEGLLKKYEKAEEFLKGIGLAPEREYIFANLTQTAHLVSKDLIPPVKIATGTGTMPLTDLMSGTLDLLYYGPLEFGTPSQKLTVDIDTGSADLWIPVDCVDCENPQFKSAMSSTYRDTGKDFSVQYGSGDVSGTLASDIVSVAGLTVEGQSFGAVSYISEEWNSYPNSGLLGMAFGTIARSRKPTFFENLIQEGKLSAPIFSIHLARNQEHGSEVCFGCYDETKTMPGPIAWVPVKSKTYWSVAMDAVIFNSTNGVMTDLVAAVDSGTTLCYLPDEITARFYSLIPGAKPATQYGPQFYTYPCSSTMDIHFSFGGQRFSLNPFDFNLGRTGASSSDCVGGILALGGGFPSNLAIIGDEFMKSWYTTFDYSNGGRIGFSPSVNNR